MWALLTALADSAWGAGLTAAARMGLDAILLPPAAHSFQGTAGMPFLADCLSPSSLEGDDDRPVVALEAVPSGLRALVRFVDRLGTGVDPAATIAKLEYIDQVEPAWQAAVAHHDRRRRSLRPRLLHLLSELAADVGHHEEIHDDEGIVRVSNVLWALSVEPLPDEPLQLEGLDPDAAVRVLEIGDRCDAFFRHQTFVELRTAARRLLVLVARRAPEALTRPSSRSLAAGICYAVIRANVERFPRHGWLQTVSISDVLGVSASGIPARARTLLAAAGIDQPPVDEHALPGFRRKPLRLSSPDLLISHRRHDIADRAGYVMCRLADCDD